MMKHNLLFVVIALLVLSACNNKVQDDNTSITPTNQAVMLCFHNSNNYSRAILPVMDSIARFKGQYVTIELINVDSMPQYIDIYGLRFIPHVIVFDSLRDTIYNRTGYFNYFKFNEMLEGKIW